MLAERIEIWNQQIREQSLHEGFMRGQAETLLRLLEARFGSTIDAATQKRIAAANGDLLLHWVDCFARAESLADVFRD